MQRGVYDGSRKRYISAKIEIVPFKKDFVRTSGEDINKEWDSNWDSYFKLNS